MTLIAITCGIYAAPYRFIDALSALYQCTVYEDPVLIKQTGQAHDLKTDLIFRSIQCRHIPFDNFTHDRKKCLAALKVQISQNILSGPCLFSGVLSHLIPTSVSGIYRIMSATPMQVRRQRAMVLNKLSSQTATNTITRSDHREQRFAAQLNIDSLWDPARYDMALEWRKIDAATHDMTREGINQALKKIRSDMASPTGNANKNKHAVDFNISSRVDAALAGLGHHLIIESDSGHVLVTLDRKIMNLARAQKEIMDLARAVPGVKSVKTKIGPNFYKTGMIRNFNLTTPFKRKLDKTKS
ncbi:cytidylate kinase family protein [uncultured Desulfobacter sp.]|uniref:cytidylate kinase family protein n=1 Tax=uncultured Desulfobacter sp. TaxID=240139 RepID=UPI0029C8FD10|nr:cytidylate kinase family protein [uncultured Desulfobacter sp.]